MGNSCSRVEKSVAERFHAKVNKTQGCWVWTAGKNSSGYGVFRVGDRMVLAHRVAWILAYGPIPEDAQVLHECDNPPCMCPEHLFLGDHLINMADMKAKGRAVGHLGNANGRAKLTDDSVRQIRKLKEQGYTNVAIAKQFSVVNQLVSRICLRECWTHVKD